ncbi:MAG: hypothetical protein RJB26_1827 [Pseudomonadota bacterium]|jgi:uncharacterized protein YcfL
MKIHTAIFWFKLLGALALAGLPLLLLVGCQSSQTHTIPAPQGITAAPTQLATR